MINKNYYLYISENILDQEVFLYKSDNYIQFTNITVPEFIIDPNTTIIFSNVKCDLSKSKFIIKKYENYLIDKTLTNCKYDSNYMQLSCNILGLFYMNNRYGYYYYEVDKKNISEVNDSKNNVYTFFSKKLSDSFFEVTKSRKDENFSIIIENKERDFYFPLIYSLTNYLINNKKTESELIYLRNSKNFIIDDLNYKIELNISLGLNQDLDINHLKRKIYNWENITEHNSIYHFFSQENENERNLYVNPTIFAYNNINNSDFIVNIIFNKKFNASNYNNFKNLKSCILIENSYKCLIDLEKTNFKIGQTQNITIEIGNMNIFTIKFIYYELNKESKQCNTLTNNNIFLYIYVPDLSLISKLELYSYITIINKSVNNNKIIYELNASEINSKETYLEMFIKDENFNHLFNLYEIGLNKVPIYNIFLENNEKKIYFIN